MIFQDPFSSLNPRMTIARHHRRAAAGQRHDRHRRRATRAWPSCWSWCSLPSAYLNRFPHAFSGGQRQRIGIARALALNPALIVADEPVSALDVSVQAQIVNLLLELQDRLGLSYLFVAHDLSVVKHVSHRVAVMYAGRIVEVAPTEALFATPRHPYTEALLSAVPVPDPRQRAQSHRAGGRGARIRQSARRAATSIRAAATRRNAAGRSCRSWKMSRRATRCAACGHGSCRWRGWRPRADMVPA